MKRNVSLILALVLAVSLMCGLAQAEDKKWPVREMTGTAVELKPGYTKTVQEQSYAGPGRGYALSGSFRPARVNKATALFREGDYVLVDLDYATAKRVVYFAARSLVSADVKRLCLMYSHTKEDIDGLFQVAEDTLKEMKKKAQLPVLIRPARQRGLLNSQAQQMLALDIRATNLYTTGYAPAIRPKANLDLLQMPVQV